MKDLHKNRSTTRLGRTKNKLLSKCGKLTSSFVGKVIPIGGILGVSLSVLTFAYQGNILKSPFSIPKNAPQQSVDFDESIEAEVAGIAMKSASPARVMAPQGAFPLQRGMAILSRLSNPEAGAPGQGSLRDGHVLGVFDIRNPGDNAAPAATALWSAATNTPFRHEQWTNAVMGEVFGVEIDNSVTSNPQIFVGSTGTFVGYINGSAEYAGRTIPAIGSDGGDVFKIDGTNGNVSVLNGNIPSVGYNTSGGRGATDITIPINTTGGGILKSFRVVNGGTGYTNGFYLLNVTGSEGGSGGSVYVTITNNSVTSIAMGAAGSAYRGDLTIVGVPGAGSGLSYEITLGYPLQTGSYPIANGGAGYTNVTNGWGPQGAIMGDGQSAGFLMTVSGGTLTSLTINAAGSNYSRDATFTINNRYTGVGNIGYNYAKKIVYTSSLDNGLIYAIDANTGNFVGAPYDHLPSVTDPSNYAISDIRRLPIGMSWNPKDNRLYFSRVSNVGYTVSVNDYNFTHSEVVSIGLNPDGSINTSDTQVQEILIPVTSLVLGQLSLITDIEFTSDGDIALLGEMSTGSQAFRKTNSEGRFTKGSHNAIAREYRRTGSSWDGAPVDYKVGDQYSGYNNAGGVDFGYGNSENPGDYYDAAVLTGDYLNSSGYVYGIQISPLSQGNYPTVSSGQFNHYIIDDNTVLYGAFAEKTGIGDVDVFSGVDFPTEEVELTIQSRSFPADCNTNDGIIVLSGTGLLPNTPYPVSYVKDGGTPVDITIVSDMNGDLSITGLGSGMYTLIQVSDPPNIQSNTVSVDLTCLPTLSLGTTDYPSTCVSTDGVIRLTGAVASTAYRIEYVKDGGAPVFVTVASNASGIIELTGLSSGNYTQVRINNDVTGQIGASLSVDLTCLPTLSLGTTNYPSTCVSTDGVIRLTGAAVSTAYRIEYVKDGGAPVFVTVASNASGIIELTGLSSGNYTQIRINNDVTGQVGASLSVDLTCLPTLSLGTTNYPSTCVSTDGVIRLTGAAASTAYRIEYVKDGGAPVFVTVASNASGIIELTGLSSGNYTQVRINNDVTGQVGASLSVDLTCLPTISEGTHTFTTTCLSEDGAIQISGLEPNTQYRIEYRKSGAAISSFVNVVSNASGDAEIEGLSRGIYNNVRINDNVTGRIGNSLTVSILALDDTICGPLPVTLVSFTVNDEKGNSNLNWSTTSETNSSHFDVHYSQDGRNWSNIGKVKAEGESEVTKRYSFVHQSIAVGENYYRLKIVDKDGSYTFSNIQSVVYKGRSEIVIAPNPVVDQIRIKSNNWDLVKSVKLVDMAGRQIFKSGAAPVDVIDSRNLKSGTYLLIIENKNGTLSTHRVLVNH